MQFDWWVLKRFVNSEFGSSGFKPLNEIFDEKLEQTKTDLKNGELIVGKAKVAENVPFLYRGTPSYRFARENDGDTYFKPATIGSAMSDGYPEGYNLNNIVSISFSIGTDQYTKIGSGFAISANYPVHGSNELEFVGVYFYLNNTPRMFNLKLKEDENYFRAYFAYDSSLAGLYLNNFFINFTTRIENG